jgi:hypothetical protein
VDIIGALFSSLLAHYSSHISLEMEFFTYNTLAFAGELLGFDQFIPPFATARGRDILVGVNYASGAAGIRDESGRELVPNNLRCSYFLPLNIFTASYDLTSLFFFFFSYFC